MTSPQGPVPLTRQRTATSAFTKRKEERWGEIIEVASDLIGERGLTQTTLGAIAERLGFRQQALYYYVRSREELLFAVLRTAMERALEALGAISDDLPPKRRLAALLRLHVGLTVRERVLFHAFYEQTEDISPEARAELRLLETRYGRVFLRAVQAAMDDGSLPSGDPRVATGALLGMATWTYRWGARLRPQEVDAAVTQMLRLVSLEEA